MIRRLRCWLLGHELYWRRRDDLFVDAVLYDLRCQSCRRPLHHIGFTNTMLATTHYGTDIVQRSMDKAESLFRRRR